MALTQIDDRGLKTPIDLLDNEKIRLGTGNDLEIYHDGNHSRISDQGTGSLVLETDSFKVNNAAGNEAIINATENGSVELFYDNSLKFATNTGGANLTGGLNVSGNIVATADGGKIIAGAGDDLQLWHNGTNSVIQNNTGILVLQSDTFNLNNSAGSEAILHATADGAVELYYNNIKKLDTNDGGITVWGSEGGDALINMYPDEGDDNPDYWRLTATAAGAWSLKNYAPGSWDTFITADINAGVELYYDNVKRVETVSDGIKLPDESNVQVGTGSDLTLRHNGSHSYITNTTGQLQIQGNGDDVVITAADDVLIKTQSNHHAIECKGDGPVDLYYDGTKKFETLSNGTKTNGLHYLQTSGQVELSIGSTDAGGAQITFDGDSNGDWTGGDYSWIRHNTDGAMEYNADAPSGATDHIFKTAGTERMRINPSGNMMVGTTSDDAGGSANTTAGSIIRGDGQIICRRDAAMFTAKSLGTGGYTAFRTFSAQTEVGSITFNSGGTAFNTASDYRRKENVVNLTDGITRLKTLKPYRFNFKNNPSKTVDGFLAHEVTAVPEAVWGTKDAVHTKDTEDNKKDDPIYQQLDQSKLVPLLTAALQEAITKIETLETKVAALEAA